MWKLQLKRLDRFAKLYGSFKVASHTSYGFWKYYDFPSSDAKDIIRMDAMTDRNIMKDEIIIETDLPMVKMNNGLSRGFERLFIKNNWSYEKWHSGNKSFHIQTFFPELMMINNLRDLQSLKKLFLLWLYNFDENAAAKHKLDLGLSGNHLIRLEHSWHTTTGSRKRLISEHEADDDNRLPDIIWKKFSDIKNKQRTIKYKKYSVFDMECVRYLFRNAVPDCRKRIMFVLITNFRDELGMEATEKLIREWNLNINSSYIPEEEISYQLSYHKNGKLTPKCPYIKSILCELGKSEICERCRR